MDAQQTIAEIQWLARAHLRGAGHPTAERATSRLRIGGMVSSKPIAHGFGCGNGMASVAEPSPQSSDEDMES
jgi:hypothetical protein